MLQSYLAIQCHDGAGNKGTFLYTGTYPAEFKLVSPVCADSVELFQWASANGWIRQPYDGLNPCGVYAQHS